MLKLLQLLDPSGKFGEYAAIRMRRNSLFVAFAHEHGQGRLIMPRGGPRVGAGRPKGSVKRPPNKPGDARQSPAGQTPLEYMLAVIHDPKADESRRDRLAVAAAPYVHPKIGEGGKKDEKQRAAKSAGAGKFAPAAPPKLVVNNR